MMDRLPRILAAFGVTGLLVAGSSAQGHTVNGPAMSVSIVAVSGYAGHAFVYAQVTDSTAAYPAPTGTGHLSPYYAQWLRQPFGSPACPWIWAVYVFDRATNRQINMPPPNAPPPNFGTTTWLCASPSVTPVEEPPIAEAAARLDLDLQVALSPSRPLAGSPAILTALLSGALTQDLDLYLNMAIEDWFVGRWSVDFGDGSSASVAGQSVTQLSVPHTYASAGTYDARVVALITGHAQAARYDPYGAVRLVRQPFSVEVANDTSATARTAPVKTYIGPLGVVTVSPALDGTAAGSPSFRHVDALRGTLTDFFVHVQITREGLIRVGAAPAGGGTSRLVRWRFDGITSDAPTAVATAPGQTGDSTRPLRLQWNAPDRVSGRGPQDYVVPVMLFVETRFSDGHQAIYRIASTFSVTVNFAAQSG